MIAKTSTLLSKPLAKLSSSRKKVLPLLLIISGIFCLLIVLSPLANYSFFKFIRPTPQFLDPADTSEYPAPIVINSADSAGFVPASDWFVKTIPLPKPVLTSITHFTLSIPRLGLSGVSVEVNGTDLKKNPIHYPGTALPGDYGNAVIFGHSALPQLFRSGNPITIFNPLLQAKLGDSVIVNFANIRYDYQITAITEVSPDEIEVLAQNYSRRELTLITCAPLGTYWHRLVVRAQIK